MSDLIDSITAPFAVAAECLLLINVLIYVWAAIRQTERSARIKRMALLGWGFSLIVTAMVVYHSVQQIRIDREYRNAHAAYFVHASIIGTVTKTTYSEPLTFRVSSGQINVGCNDTQRTNVIWTVPQDATDVQSAAAWEHTDNLRSQAQTISPASPAARQITAAGSISGLDRTFFGNCAGGGHGELVLKGTYRLAKKEAGKGVLREVYDRLNKGQPFLIAIPRDPAIVPDSCLITVQEGNRREEIGIDFRVEDGGRLAIKNQTMVGNIPVAINLDENRILVTVL